MSVQRMRIHSRRRIVLVLAAALLHAAIFRVEAAEPATTAAVKAPHLPGGAWVLANENMANALVWVWRGYRGT
ncbi:MAG: hypothetical protein JSR15_11005 [Proteobacteria bacterium]|nr:hypothetical protein [Pseudomonadota bacterium]